MLTLRNSGVMLKTYSHSCRRMSFWRLLVAAASECRGRKMPAMRTSRRKSSVSSHSVEHTEAAVPDELAEMRSRMSKLHNVVSSKGVSLADYKRTSNEDERDDNNRASLQEINNEDDHLEDSSNQIKSLLDGLGKGLRKPKDVDVVINMTYGHVRFDSMNTRKSALPRVSEENSVMQDDVPSVKVIKDGQHVFSLAAEQDDSNLETDLEHGSEDIARDEMCHTSSQRWNEIYDRKPNLFDEQYFNDMLQQEEVKQRNVARNPAVNGEMCSPKPGENYNAVLQHEEQKQTCRQQENDKQRNIARNATTNTEVCDLKMNLFDEQYFGNVLQHEEQNKTDDVTAVSKMMAYAVRNIETVDTKPNVFDEQYFSEVLQEEKQQSILHSSHSARNGHVEGSCRQQNKLNDTEKSGSDLTAATASISDEHLSLIDGQYFSNYAQSKLAPSQKAEQVDNSKGDLFNFSQMPHCYEDHHHSLEADISDRRQQRSTQVKLNDSVATLSSNSASVWKEVEEIIRGSVTDDDKPIVVEPITRREMKSRTRPQADVENPKTAYDLLMKIRQEQRQKQSSDTDKKQQTFGMNPDTNYYPHLPIGKGGSSMSNTGNLPFLWTSLYQKSKIGRTGQRAGYVCWPARWPAGHTGSACVDRVLPKDSKWTGRVDSRGFRILQDQVVSVQQLTQEQLLLILKDSIIHEDDKLVVIDKPYGLPSHGGPGVHHSVGKLLDSLASQIDRTGLLRTLYLVHRLDKDTTGVMVLAKSLQVAEFLLAMFKKRQVVKHYWVITKSVPNPQEGIIDIPMAEDIVGNRYRMALRPIVQADGRPVRPSLRVSNSSEAVTRYRVLSENGSAALVECTPETGVKHQIRCHLAFGLNTPILGDHKYSHYSKLAPQKLHPEMLQKLGVRQAKVRHIPMHLHAKAVVLPEWIDGRNLFLSARLPAHFVQNMKWLKLKPPR